MRLQGANGSAPRLELDAEVDRFKTEWSLLEISIRAIWSDLSPEELESVREDRIALEAMLRRKYGYGTELAHQLCTGVEELHERFNGQWEVVRECVPRYWTDISAKDVATMSGTMTELAGLVARRNGLTADAARDEVSHFLEKIDYGMLVRLFGTKGAAPQPGQPQQSQQAVAL